MHGYDSLNIAHLIKEFMFLDNRPVNYDLIHQPRSQDLPNYYALNFAINIISRENMTACKNAAGKSPLIYAVYGILLLFAAAFVKLHNTALAELSQFMQRA